MASMQQRSHLPHSSDGATAEQLSILTRIVDRRRALGLFSAAAGAAVFAACGSDRSASSSAGAGSTAATTSSTSGAADGSTTSTTSTRSEASTTSAVTEGVSNIDASVTPPEMAGPFPSDGTNDNGEGATANVLSDARVVRSDIRADFGDENLQAGVPMTLTVTVLDAATDLPKAGAAVYVWHCNQQGTYSQYNSPMLGGDFSDYSWLRGAQVADAKGNVTFQTILPGRYTGRAAHIHFEVFEDETYSTKLLTSQMAFDDDDVDALYTAANYTEALASDTDNADDLVFSDGVEDQLLTITGDTSDGLTATMVVGI